LTIISIIIQTYGKRIQVFKVLSTPDKYIIKRVKIYIT
jgi:hypothetical protein